MMGLLDVFRGIRDVVDSVVDTARDVGDILKDGAAEGREIMTDGVYEIFVKGNTDYKTSFEKVEEADWEMAQARTAHMDKLKSVEDAYSALKETIAVVQERRGTVLGAYAANLESFSLPEEIRLGIQATRSRLTGVSDWKLPSVTNPVNVEIANMVVQHQRVEAADLFVADVKDYITELRIEELDMNRLQMNIQVLQQEMENEEKLLETLEQLRKRMSPDDRGQVAEKLYHLIREPFFSKDCERTENYEAAIGHLKKLVNRYSA